jgi:ferric-dicitrate binding protein FerR (iron transport regulator)
LKDYARFSVEELIMDEHFQSWVFDPGGTSDAYWQSWLEENPHKAADVEEARATLLRLNFSRWELPAEEVSNLWNRIKHVKEKQPYQHRFTNARPIAWSAAAAVLLLAGLTAYFWKAQTSVVEYRTAFGETKSITLPDSSTVILNSNSLLRLNSIWEPSSPREVWLDGEAFFSVISKKDKQPFTVKTEENVAIEVLGTTFNVYHRNETKVVLNSGLIQLSLPTVQADEKVMMIPGELVEYNEKKYVKRKVDPKMYTAWTENNLVLNRTSLREMLLMIKDNYGIDIEVNESLLNQTISGSMPVTDSVSLMHQIAKAFQLKVIKEGDRYYMREQK